jgi:hypothetical protein
MNRSRTVGAKPIHSCSRSACGASLGLVNRTKVQWRWFFEAYTLSRRDTETAVAGCGHPRWPHICVNDVAWPSTLKKSDGKDPHQDCGRRHCRGPSSGPEGRRCALQFEFMGRWCWQALDRRKRLRKHPVRDGFSKIPTSTSSRSPATRGNGSPMRYWAACRWEADTSRASWPATTSHTTCRSRSCCRLAQCGYRQASMMARFIPRLSGVNKGDVSFFSGRYEF